MPTTDNIFALMMFIPNCTKPVLPNLLKMVRQHVTRIIIRIPGDIALKHLAAGVSGYLFSSLLFFYRYDRWACEFIPTKNNLQDGRPKNIWRSCSQDISHILINFSEGTFENKMAEGSHFGNNLYWRWVGAFKKNYENVVSPVVKVLFV